MKKIVSIVCILLLLVATSNLKINIHFCGGEISSIDFFGKSSNCGGSCNSKAAALKENSCCKNLTAIITTSAASSSDYSFQVQQQTAAPVSVVFAPMAAPVYAAKMLKGAVSTNAPPELSVHPYYILYRSLII
ncbi:MAG: HYC_CC_PP family protein [Cytophaga sp.]|uniref:HYC_CC_PP family protein n=1 Tax=Cytophaga sp. TaxID=29535 RepID=UPI003F7E1376